MKKIIFRSIIGVLLSLIIILVSSSTFAAPISIDGIDLDGEIEGLEGFKGFSNDVLGGMWTVGIILAVIVMVIIGIKYMVGSAEDRAAYKKSLMPYVIGVMLLVSTTSISNIAFDFANTVKENVENKNEGLKLFKTVPKYKCPNGHTTVIDEELLAGQCSQCGEMLEPQPGMPGYICKKCGGEAIATKTPGSIIIKCTNPKCGAKEEMGGN